MGENGDGQDGTEVCCHFRVFTFSWYFKKQVLILNNKDLTS